jgi:hypothetical protein
MVNLPAQAEWQYTRWGMSVDEVMTASKGAAIPVNPKEQILFEEEDRQTLLKSQWSKEGYAFDVFFNFSPLLSLRGFLTNLRGFSLRKIKLRPQSHKRGLVSVIPNYQK